MLFEAMSAGRRIVEVYEKTITYELEDGEAFRVTPSGQRRPVAYHQALDEIAGWRERDGRAYRYDMDTRQRDYFWAGIVLILGTIALALVAMLG